MLDVASWPGLTLVEPLTGGARSAVFRARRGHEDLVVRRSGRALEALDWELDLVEYLDGHGIPVPVAVSADAVVRHAWLPAMVGAAWEAATCWLAEPDYAARRLAELHRRLPRHAGHM